MVKHQLSIDYIARRRKDGGQERLNFATGVNLLVGAPNTGKTKWLQTLDYLLGDLDENPYDRSGESGLEGKYDAAATQLSIGSESILVRRRWLEPRIKTKILVGEDEFTPKEFQQWLITKLGMPTLHFPKGNPMSGQTWPELSFRMILRHIYRQQRFWGGIADQQPEGEQHAVLLQFFGLAEKIFTEEYGELISYKLDVQRLKARREQWDLTLQEFARGVLSGTHAMVSVTRTSIATAKTELQSEIENLRLARISMLTVAQVQALTIADQIHVASLGEKRATILAEYEGVQLKLKEALGRFRDFQDYQHNLAAELDRISRAEDAAEVLADLKVTHCPACDQTVDTHHHAADTCFLCHQVLSDDPQFSALGTARVRFERERIEAELREAKELLDLLDRDIANYRTTLLNHDRSLVEIENELIPARTAVGALAQDEVSSIDQAIGKAAERSNQIDRLAGAYEVGQQLTTQIANIEKTIEPLEERVDALQRSIDFEAVAGKLEDGMNDYLDRINRLRPNVWKHSRIAFEIGRSGFQIKVGRRKWNAALGGTDTLYFLMAYHFGLLTLSSEEGMHYPGLCIIDVPGEFSGEAIGDAENFIVQPFIDLMQEPTYKGCQIIMTGASFEGLNNTTYLRQTYVHAS